MKMISLCLPCSEDRCFHKDTCDHLKLVPGPPCQCTKRNPWGNTDEKLVYQLAETLRNAHYAKYVGRKPTPMSEVADWRRDKWLDQARLAIVKCKKMFTAGG